MTKRSKKNAAAWLDGAAEVPREGVQANRDRSKRQKFYRRFIVAAVILLPLSLLTNVLSFGAVNRAPTTVAAADQVPTEGKAAAILAVQAWLTATPSPVPGGGRMLSWDGFTVMDKPEQTEAQARQAPLPEYELETHQFTIVDGYGTTYTSEVQVAVDPIAGAHVIGTPSLLPRPLPTGTTPTGSPWFGYTTTTVPAPVQSAIHAWAKAFTSGDPDALRLVVQDDNGEHTYMPLYNVVTHKVEPRAGAFIPGPDHDPAQPVTSGKQMLVRVVFSIEWVGAAPVRSGDSRPTITYDLLVDNVGGGAPVVVAWGGPGSGPTLVKHGNAMDGRPVVAVPAPRGQQATDPVPTEPETETDAAVDGVDEAGE